MKNIPLDETAAKEAWKKIGIYPRHGIDLPLSALRTHKSSGIGEFYDLIPLSAWCHCLGLNVIQLLPLNDSGNDPSPYNALSSCALHPIYLSLHKLPHVKNLPDASDLNQAEKVLYASVKEMKLAFLRTYYEKEGMKLLKTSAFEEFASNNKWLIPYSLFKVLKDRCNQKSWMHWEKSLKNPNIPLLLDKFAKEIPFYLCLQYLCFLQLSDVKKELSKKGILLKGDIPILISPDSADCWSQPELFSFSEAAGAPPDAYNAEGQYWGFPLLNWEKIKATDFAWWKERLKTASQYYDIYRIDHAVGFFRLWAIPLNEQPKKGRFVPEDKKMWTVEGKKILQHLLKASTMLPIAEDLGDVPPEARECLTELGICGTKVLRWERDYKKGGTYLPYEHYPALSLTTLSTHDSETLQLWWMENTEDVNAFCAFKGWEYTPTLSFEHRLALLKDSHSTPSLFHINLLQEYLALFPDLVSLNPMDERINIPGRVLSSNWSYRFRPFLEDIILHKGLTASMQRVLESNKPV